MRKLRELLQNVAFSSAEGDQDVLIAGIAYDSRLAKPGDLFVALPGFHTDGALFILDAVRRGAVAVATQQPDAPVPAGIPFLLVPDARRALTDLAAAFFDYPARRLRVVGVTGTDGKTTTTHLVSAALEAMGHRTGLLTTVDVKVGDRLWYNDTQHTTPEPVEVQGWLRQMVDEGVNYSVLESSSHALALDRLLHCEFDAAVFTNLSPEHLDFHGTLEGYLAAKARLFAMLDSAAPKGVEKMAVLNADDPHSTRLAGATGARALWYGLLGGAESGGRRAKSGDGGAGSRGDGEPGGRGAGGTRGRGEREAGSGERRDEDRSVLSPQSSVLVSDAFFVGAADLQLLPNRSRFRLVTPLGSVEVESRLAGEFNVYNWLAAATLALGHGASLEQIRQAMALTDSVPGRMQRIGGGQPFNVVVDFAHTPQALQTVLSTLRPLTPGRLIVLFGMAGERDASNRPVAGRVAATLADLALFTTDDPRFEDPMEIAEQIAAGARAEGWREGEHYLKIADREEALREAFRRARSGDTVLLAGKGHERRQVIGNRLVPWNDAEAARRVLADLGW